MIVKTQQDKNILVFHEAKKSKKKIPLALL